MTTKTDTEIPFDEILRLMDTDLWWSLDDTAEEEEQNEKLNREAFK